MDNKEKMKQSQQQVIIKRRMAISEVSKSIKEREDMPITDFMDTIQRLIKACGGEDKPEFLEVSAEFIKVRTRLPLNVNLFPFLPDTEDNERFHVVVTKSLLGSSMVKAIRWYPVDGGAVLVASLKGKD